MYSFIIMHLLLQYYYATSDNINDLFIHRSKSWTDSFVLRELIALPERLILYYKSYSMNKLILTIKYYIDTWP